MITFEQLKIADPYNVNKKRNLRNTDKRFYNCAGYALGTFSWYQLGRNTAEHDLLLQEMENENWETVISIGIETILKELPDWFVVAAEDVKNKKYDPKQYEIVAMRFYFGDYHFWKLGKNRRWYDKMGRCSFIEAHCFNEVFSPEWNYQYTSPITFFARAR